MKLRRQDELVAPAPWARYRYSLTTGLGEGGRRLTGSREHIALSRRAAAEGMVLLENHGILPLKQGTVVALFGTGHVDYVKGGGGSGMVYSAYVRDLYEGMCQKEPYISVFHPLSEYYIEQMLPMVPDYGDFRLLPQIPLPEALVEQAAAAADVAVITIHRFSGEGRDRKAQKGDFYLTDEEQALVDRVCAAFDHCVVVLDVGGMVDVSWIRENPKIDAALLAWQAGMEGGAAIADILCGDVNPSGKLTDTFAKTFADYPSADTFHESDDYVCYYEDIYVGYRYFETIPGAAERVVYPFGYGLSYTSFSFSKPVACIGARDIQVKVRVKNTGARAGREVAQVYVRAPQGKLGKSALSLVAFEKTPLLAPGEEVELTMGFSLRDLASYDDTGKCRASAYVLEQGEYIFLVGNQCRHLTEAEARYVIKEPYVVVEQLERRCAPCVPSRRMRSDGSFEPLPAYAALRHKVLPAATEQAAPSTEKPIPLEMVKRGDCTLDGFLAQATNDELVRLMGGCRGTGLALTHGMGGGMERLGVPHVMTADGPAGVRIHPRSGIATTAWPCATLLACTWDVALMEEIGAAGAVECKENALAVWLTPALNIHRNPLCGRNFEYFSEDPLVAGKFAAAKVRGIQSMQVAATPKHFAANNKETNRLHSDSRLSERALREIYLRGFEICVKEADPWVIMDSYNIINSRRCSQSYEQISGILRGEWGYRGMVCTDWGTPGDTVECVLAGTDVSMPDGVEAELHHGLFDGRLKRGHLLACAKRVLEMILKLE